MAYAVARHAKGLVVVAEEHRDEFRAVAQYLNEVAEASPEAGIAVWLVEARAVRIDNRAWARLFTAVVEPNSFTAKVELAKRAERPQSMVEFLDKITDESIRAATETVVTAWETRGFQSWIGPSYVSLRAPGPSANGLRSVVSLGSDGVVFIPFGSYAGTNTGLPIESLSTVDFRRSTEAVFGHLLGGEKQARTGPGWLTADRIELLLQFCARVAAEYGEALKSNSFEETDKS